MAIRTVGDLLNLPQALEARMQQKEIESQHRAGEFVARLFGETYNPYGVYGGYGLGMDSYTPNYSNSYENCNYNEVSTSNRRPKLTQHLHEMIDPSDLIYKDD